MQLLNQALPIFRRIQAQKMVEKVASLQEQLALPCPVTPVYPDGLTHREVEVLRLVASGKSSAEIAEELVLSRRTVERHISNIYSKTDSHNRSEVTAFAFTQGLISST
jgi:DNA-binding NarL/FixJ family response regulator